MRQTLRRWGFDFVVAVVVHREVFVAGEIEHRMVPAAGHKVAAVVHTGAFVVDMDNFVMEVVLRTGWAAVPALQALFHSWYKIVGQE